MLLNKRLGQRDTVMRDQRRQQIIKEIQLGITAELRALAAFPKVFAQQRFKIGEQAVCWANAITQGENIRVKRGCDCTAARVKTAFGFIP